VVRGSGEDDERVIADRYGGATPSARRSDGRDSRTAPVRAHRLFVELALPEWPFCPESGILPP
jgi:hypothetical protein